MRNITNNLNYLSKKKENSFKNLDKTMNIVETNNAGKEIIALKKKNSTNCFCNY